jgi:hypothetical protein
MTENEVPATDAFSRTWELKRVYSWYYLVAFGSIAILLWQGHRIIHPNFNAFGFFLNPEWTVSWLGLATLWTWLIWVYIVNFFMRYPVKRITLDNGIHREMRFETIWHFQPVISTGQISRIRPDWWTGLSLEYQATSLLWRVLSSVALMPTLILSPRQFPNRESWEEFVACLNDGFVSETPIVTSNYPSTYAEVPCPACGLTIPAYEPHCPNCASPRENPVPLCR